MKTFFSVLLVFLISQLPAVNQDQYEVVGHEMIHAKVGDDVILPCHVKPPIDVSKFAIEWKFKNKKIYVHRSQKKDETESDPEYKTRTSLFHDEFEKGNISLKLTNVTKEDEGNYTCFVSKLARKVKRGNVTLKVDGNRAQSNRTGPEGTDDVISCGAISCEVMAGIIAGVIGGVIGGVVGGLLVGFIIYCVERRKRGEPIFPCRSKNNSRHEQGRNDREQNRNGNPEDEDEDEEIPLHNMEQPNQRVDESSPLS